MTTGTARWCGEDVLAVRGDGWEVLVSPRRGGKIVSLRRGGVEWLAQPELPLAPAAAPGASFVEAEMCGWDECAPSIVACTVGGHPVPDHGELWTARWRAQGAWLATTGETFGYRFARRIAPRGARIRIDYRVRAGDAAVPLLWAAHPQFSAPPGSVVQVSPPQAGAVDVLATPPAPVGLSPELLAVATVPADGCRKLYLEPDRRAAEARLVRPDGTAVRLTWDVAVAPYLGIWFDRGAYSREDVVALEPSTGFYDSLAGALDAGRVPVVAPGTELAWWCEVSFDDPPADRAG